jgi:hypothetical protein
MSVVTVAALTVAAALIAGPVVFAVAYAGAWRWQGTHGPYPRRLRAALHRIPGVVAVLTAWHRRRVVADAKLVAVLASWRVRDPHRFHTGSLPDVLRVLVRALDGVDGAVVVRLPAPLVNDLEVLVGDADGQVVRLGPHTVTVDTGPGVPGSGGGGPERFTGRS